MDPCPGRGARQIGRLAQRQDVPEAFQKSGKDGIVLPGLEVKRFEPLRQLRIRQQCLAGEVGPCADQGNPQIVGEESYGIEENPLLPICPGQHAVHLVENDHLRPDRSQQRAADIFLAGQCAPGHCRRAHTGQQFAVKIPLDRLGGYLCNHHWAMIDAGYLTELWRVITFKLAPVSP